MRKFLNNQKGLTLLECVILLIISGIVLVTAIGSYIHFLKVSSRQQRVMAVERSLTAIQSSLQQAMITLPGQGLGTSSGITFGNPLLPAAGSMPDSKGKTTPIRLGIVTPYKVNGQDAFTIAYADPKAPCLVLAEPSTASIASGTGTGKVAFPILIPIKPPINPGGGGVTIDPYNFKTDSSNGETNIIIPPHTPTPTPTPSPVATPDPTPVPPNVPFNTTLLGLPWMPSADSFKVGDLMLLVAPPIYDDTNNVTTVSTESRLIRITSVTAPPPKLPQAGTTPVIEFSFDLCSTGQCGSQLPGLSNVPLAPTKFTTGSLVVPLKVSSFYFKQDQMSRRLVRNDGGVFLPDGSGGFNIQGGQETILGETDSLAVNYHLKDGTTQPTPASPLVPWLNDVTSVDISIIREIPSTKTNELLSRKLTLNFPITIRNFE